MRALQRPLAFFFLWAGQQATAPPGQQCCLSMQQNLAAPACPGSRRGSHLARTRMDCAEGKIWSPVRGLNLCHGTPRTLVIRTFMCTQLGWGAPTPTPRVWRDRPMPKTTAQALALLTSCNNQDLKTCHHLQVSSRFLWPPTAEAPSNPTLLSRVQRPLLKSPSNSHWSLVMWQPAL